MLLAIQGTILAGAGDHTTGAAMNDTAVALAEEIGDQRLLGHCMLAKAGRLLLGMRVAESLEAGERAMSLLRSSGALYDVAGSIGLTMISASMSGRFDRARALEEDLGPLVERVGHPGGLFGLHTQRGFRALADGPDLRGFEDEARAADELSRRVNLTASMGVGPVQLGMNEMFRGRLPDAVNAFRRGIELEPPGARSGAAAGFLLLALAYAGRRDELLDEWKRLRPTIPVPGRPAGIGAWTTALAAIEALALVEERSAAASLGPVVGAALEQGTLHREFDLRSLHTIAGIAARCAERWSDAERSFDVAISAADSVPLHLEAADARRYYAEMLLARGKRADRDRARELANEALKVYERAGMPMHVGLARELAARG
jgi:tetratricopeptide (TPR) repeat protein